MRLATVGALLSLVFAIPPALAQGSQATDSRISDPADDVEIRQANQSTARLGPAYSYLDIRGAWVSNETATEFEVGVQLRAWQDPLAERPPYSRQLSIAFTFNGQAYAVVDQVRVGSQNSPVACLPGQATFGPVESEVAAPADGVACVNATVDAAAAVWKAFVPKAAVKSLEQVPIQEGDALTQIVAYSSQFILPGVFALDRAPDAQHGPVFLLQKGLAERHGNLFLVPTVPVRASNGESTTMVFPVTLTNRNTADDTVLVTTEVDHASWNVRAPQRIEAPAGKGITFPVILSMDFTHGHGQTQYFSVKAESTTAPGEYAKIPLGVHWLDVPQPAGHHDRLWLHSSSTDFRFSEVTLPGSVMGTRAGWMNAVEKDPRPDATEEDVPGFYGPDGPAYTLWIFPLQPDLQIGLDLDHSRTGVLETGVRSTLPSTSAVLDAFVEHCGPASMSRGPVGGYCGPTRTSSTLFSGRADAGTLPLNGEASFSMELKPSETLDVIPYQAGSLLHLRLQLQHDTPQTLYMNSNAPTPQVVVRGSLLTLPLTEYHDPVDQAFQNIGTVSLQALDAAEKGVNPGRAAAFRFDVTNHDSLEHSLHVFAEGINVEWASIAGDTEFRLQPGDRRQTTLLVRAPDDAQPGERAEIFLVAEGVDEPNLVALARLRATVVDVEVADLTDEARILDGESGSTPAPSVVLAACMAAVAALTWRRRQ